MTKKIFAIAMLTFLLVGCSSGEGSSIDADMGVGTDEEIEFEGMVEESSPSEKKLEALVEGAFESVGEGGSGEIVGSCNSIEAHSACVDYTGSFWTWQTISLGCSGEEGMFALHDACPARSVGGCRVGAGSATEMTTWFYDFGGEPINPENAQYAMGACNTTLGSSWTGQN